MKEEISQQLINDLKFHKNNVLLYNGLLMCIEDFTIIEETQTIKGNWFKKEKTETKQYLTSINILVYSDKYDKLGYMYEKNAWHLIYFYDISALRNDWLKLKKQIQMFGAEIQMKPKTNENN